MSEYGTEVSRNPVGREPGLLSGALQAWLLAWEGFAQLCPQRPEAQVKGSDTLVEQDPCQSPSGSSGTRGNSLSSARRWEVGLTWAP